MEIVDITLAVLSGSRLTRHKPKRFPFSSPSANAGGGACRHYSFFPCEERAGLEGTAREGRTSIVACVATA